MRIVRLANFVAPHSGGLRTALAELGAGYLAAGHEPVLVIPGERDGDERTAQGRVITLRAPRLPLTGGYRVLCGRRRLGRLLAVLRPDALEVSDRTTLRWTGAWARARGVPAVMVSHESVTALLRLAGLGPALARAVADWLNRRTARAYHRVICTTSWAATEFEQVSLLASADVAIAPGPAETFGLAALEALACGTPVVVSAESALPEVVGEAGAAVPGEDLAAGVRAVLARPEAARRAAARARAERYDWDRCVRGFLAVHGVVAGVEAGRRPA